MTNIFRMALMTSVVVVALGSQAIAQSGAVQFSGSYNIVLHSNCAPIKDLRVTIHATQDIVGPKGLGFQLNAIAPPASSSEKEHPDGPPAGAQQYMMGIGPQPGIDYAVELFPFNFNAKSLIFVPSVYFWTMPSVVLPEGYTLTIALGNSGDKVVAADFTVQDNHGYPVAFRAFPLILAPGASQKDFSPVTAFQMNLVGPTGGDSLSQGAGWIKYTASTPLTYSKNYGYPTYANGQSCVAEGISTGENSNIVYSPMSRQRDNSFLQTFYVPQRPASDWGGPISSAPACVAPLKWSYQQQKCSMGGSDTYDQAPIQNPGQPGTPRPQ